MAHCKDKVIAAYTCAYVKKNNPKIDCKKLIVDLNLNVQMEPWYSVLGPSTHTEIRWL